MTRINWEANNQRRKVAGRPPSPRPRIGDPPPRPRYLYVRWDPNAAAARGYTKTRTDNPAHPRYGVEPRDAGFKRRQEARKRRESPGIWPL